jgi:MoaA/NifB/PqqE/SkfB family radical SAM enzyme
MRNALTYLTRRCPRACTYCALRDSKGVGKELDAEDWIAACEILEEMGIDFNLILGNETWLLKEHLMNIMANNKVPYAIYTTCPEPLFSEWKDRFIPFPIDNLSCGLDYPYSYLKDRKLTNDMERKSMDAWKGFQWLKNKYPNIDSQGTVTVNRLNYRFLPDLVRETKELGVFCGINFIHYDIDGGYDFFPKKEVISDMVFYRGHYSMLKEVMEKVLETENLVQNPEMLKVDIECLTEMGWHCRGNPYSGPTIDADGSLRVCGYRKGERVSKMSIFDLPKLEDDWKEAVYLDAMDCPGCMWSYPWMFHYWMGRDEKFGENVFVHHAGEHIPEDQWAKRNVN